MGPQIVVVICSLFLIQILPMHLFSVQGRGTRGEREGMGEEGEIVYVVIYHSRLINY